VLVGPGTISTITIPNVNKAVLEVDSMDWCQDGVTESIGDCRRSGPSRLSILKILQARPIAPFERPFV
jgi:hypothetical protein